MDIRIHIMAHANSLEIMKMSMDYKSQNKLNYYTY